jgi:hypothetical protein
MGYEAKKTEHAGAKPTATAPTGATSGKPRRKATAFGVKTGSVKSARHSPANLSGKLRGGHGRGGW